VFTNAYGNTERNRFVDNRNWSNGKFDIRAFTGGKRIKNNRDQNPLFKHLDVDPVTEQSKYRDIVTGYMEDLDYEITATTINPVAKALREEQKYQELANLALKKSGFTQKINGMAGKEVMPKTKLPFEAASEQELNLYYMLGGAKEVAELEIELANSIVQNDSDWKAIKKKLLEDAFDTGRMIVDTEYSKSGRVLIKYVDPVNTGVEDYRGHYLKRPARIWTIDFITVQELLLDAGNQFSIADGMVIAEQYAGKFGNPVWSSAQQGWQTYINTDSTYPFPYYFFSFKVPVMKAYWEELDVYSQNGQEMFLDPTKVEQNKKKDGIYVHNYYQAKWIVNSDYIYNYGKVPFQARDPYDIRFALCPMKYYRITQQPMAERIKPFAKKIYMTWQKIDNEVAQKMPTGYKLNIKALENISLGEGQTFTVKHAVELGNETGRWLYADEASADEFGRTIKKDPIVPLDFSTPFRAAVEGWIQLINFYEDRIVKLTGINEFMDATNPNSNTPATVAKLATQGTKHSLSQIASGLLDMGEKIAVDVSERVRLVVAEQGEYSGYADALGSGLTESAKVTPKVATHRFAIKVSARPTASERDAMKQAIYQSFASMASPEQGGLWVGMVLQYQEMVDAGMNMKIIRILMEAKQREMLAILQQQKMQAIQEQAKANQDMAAQQQQGAMQQLSAEKQMELQFQQAMTEEINKRNQALVQDKTISGIVKDSHKSSLKIQEKMADLAE